MWKVFAFLEEAREVYLIAWHFLTQTFRLEAEFQFKSSDWGTQSDKVLIDLLASGGLHLLVKVRLPFEILQHLRLQFAHLLVHLGQRLRALYLFTFLLLLELFALAPIAEKYRNASKQHSAACKNACRIHGEFLLLPRSVQFRFACVAFFLLALNERKTK